MTWFKVDDKFHSHPKVIEAGNAAAGLFIRCGSYSCDQLTDGFIPRQVAAMYGTPREIAKLIEVGLWTDAQFGFRMPDFLAYNPSREKVEAERQAAADRQRKARDKAKESRQTNAEVPTKSRRDKSVSHASVTVPPTRPDPKTPLRAVPDAGAKSLWDALGSHFEAPTTTTERTNRGRQVKELTAAGATAEEVHARVQEHKRRRLTWTLTANALVSHWSELAPEQAKEDRVWDEYTNAWVTRRSR